MPTRPSPPIDPSDLLELSLDERLNLANKRWKEDKTILMVEIARKHGVPKSTLKGRIDGAVSATVRQQSRQKLSPEEETALCDWILRLQAWEVSKAACFTMAERTIQSATTNELLELNKRKERNANRAKGNWGNARVMNQDVIDQRKKDAAEKFAEKNAEKALKEWNKEEKRLRALGPNIFAPQPFTVIKPPPPHFSSAKTSARELAPPGDSSAETSQKNSDIASKGDYSGATAGSLGAAERKAGELRGASESTNGKMATCQKAS
ncbi:hypothetical protein OEA41_005464 [Lepraria neglecta]|uniref:HTH CENPB-type domain-containing protein n=1 Tax=Lepraria neglecta TaxID=209136 RepID=A0AAE0DGQ3_9LECA|nr:hypothetical protein OEA41_005464 [Lepraria neglecta]